MHFPRFVMLHIQVQKLGLVIKATEYLHSAICSTTAADIILSNHIQHIHQHIGTKKVDNLHVTQLSQTVYCCMEFNINTHRSIETRNNFKDYNFNYIYKITIWIKIQAQIHVLLPPIKMLRSISILIVFIFMVFVAIQIQGNKMHYLSNNAFCISFILRNCLSAFMFVRKAMFETSLRSMIYTFGFGFVLVINCTFTTKYNYSTSILLTNCFLT